MNNDDEIKRLKRIAALSLGLVVGMLIVLAILASLQFRRVNNAIQLMANSKPEIIKGIDGPQGEQGIQGIPGINGANGKSVTPDQIAEAVTTYLQANPPVAPQGNNGHDGTDGTDGRTPQIQLNTQTCQLQFKYDTSDFWTTLAQLPIPCGVNP